MNSRRFSSVATASCPAGPLCMKTTELAERGRGAPLEPPPDDVGYDTNSPARPCAVANSSGCSEHGKQFDDMLRRRQIDGAESQSCLPVEQKDLRRMRSRRRRNAAQKLRQGVDILHSGSAGRPKAVLTEATKPAVKRLRAVSQRVDGQAQQLHIRRFDLLRHGRKHRTLNGARRRTAREHQLHCGDLAAQQRRQANRSACGVGQRQIGCRHPRQNQPARRLSGGIHARTEAQAGDDACAQHPSSGQDPCVGAAWMRHAISVCPH